MLRNLLRRWLLDKDLDQNIIELYSEHRTILQLFGEMTKRVYRAEESISKLRNTGPDVFLHLRTLEERIDALEWREQPRNPPFRNPPVQPKIAMRVPKNHELSAVWDSRSGESYEECFRLLFDLGRNWQSMAATGEMRLFDKGADNANVIIEALSKLRVPVNPGNNGDQPDQLSDSPDA
jgi:hypothetical protein